MHRTVATSIVRLTYLPATLKSHDPSWDAAPADVWTFAEGNLFVICGSMPTVRRFVRHFFPSMFGVNSPLPSKDSAQSTIVTFGFGRTRKRQQYSQFEDDGNELELFQDATALKDGKTVKPTIEAMDRSTDTDPGRGLEADEKQKPTR